MWTLQDAKNRFSAVVDAAIAGTPQEVSRRGKPAVVIVAADEFARLLNEARNMREGFVEHLLAFPAGDVAEADTTRPEARPRDVAF